jgi:hypothetical protein
MISGKMGNEFCPVFEELNEEPVPGRPTWNGNRDSSGRRSGIVVTAVPAADTILLPAGKIRFHQRNRSEEA